MKRTDLIREIRQAAKGRGLRFESVRDTGRHEVFECGTVRVAIPRHRDIGPKLAFEIRAELEPALGFRWWR